MFLANISPLTKRPHLLDEHRINADKKRASSRNEPTEVCQPELSLFRSASRNNRSRRGLTFRDRAAVHFKRRQVALEWFAARTIRTTPVVSSDPRIDLSLGPFPLRKKRCTSSRR